MTHPLQPLKIIHIALCSGVALAYVFITDWQTVDLLKLPEWDTTALMALLIPLGAAIVGNLLYRLQLKNTKARGSLEDNLPIYQTAALIRWALLEGAAFLLLFLTPDFVVFGLLVILYMVLLRPTETVITRDIGLFGK